MAQYIFGGDTGETPESIARQREIAMALMGQGNLVAPRNTMDGIGNALASIGTGFAAGAWNRKADEAEKAGRGGADSLFQQLVGGISNGTPITGAAPSPGAQPTSAPAQGGDMSAYQNAISGIESGGKYDAVGPTHPTLGRALGRYQVMESNIAPWSKAALGREVSPEEFLANPQIQDAVFNSQFGQYVKQYGPQGAAQAWFAGPGGIGTNRQDSLGTSVPEYTQKFNAALGGGDQAQMPVNAQPTQGAGQQPPQMQGGPSMQQIMQVLSNPWSTPQQRSVAEMLLQQQMEAQDPMRQLQMEKGRLEVDALRNPQPRALMNAGDGRLYDPNSGQWITAPDAGAQFRQAAPEEAAKYGAPAGQFGPDGRFYPINPPSGTALAVGPNGEIQFQQGAGVKPLTEQQSKDTVYATRARGAATTLDKLEGALTSGMDNFVSGMPFGNYGVSEEFQRAQQAGKEWLAPILRKDTGAAVTVPEEKMYGDIYLPRPGDSPATIQQKREARARALLAVEAGMPPAAILQQERALSEAAKGSAGQGTAPTKPIADMTDEELEAIVNGKR